MPSSLYGQKGVEYAGMAKHVEIRECWWRHLSGGRLVEGSNAHVATASCVAREEARSDALVRRPHTGVEPMAPNPRLGFIYVNYMRILRRGSQVIYTYPDITDSQLWVDWGLRVWSSMHF